MSAAKYLRSRAEAIRKHAHESPKDTLSRIGTMTMAHNYEQAASEIGALDAATADSAELAALREVAEAARRLYDNLCNGRTFGPIAQDIGDALTKLDSLRDGGKGER